MKKRIMIATMLGCMALLPGAFAQAVVDGILAVVNETPITLHEEEIITRDEQLFLREKYGDQPEVFRRKVIEHRQNALQYLVDRDVILADSKESIKVPESIIDEFVNERIKEKYPDHVVLVKQLEADGVTMEQYKRQFRDQIIVDQMRLKNVPEPIISPLRVENFYNKHRDDFKVDDEIKMRMIFLSKGIGEKIESNRRRANEILSQVNDGASFEELAKTYSEGSLREQGGETGWEELSVVKKELASELLKLKTGGHTGVIEQPEGFYILLLEDRHPAHFKPLADVREKIEATLATEETDRLQKEWVARLKKKTYVSMF